MDKLTARGREMLELLRRHEAGESLILLAAEAGVAKSPLGWWRSKLRRHLARESVEFVEVKVARESSATITVRIGEVSLEAPAGCDVEHVARLIGALRSC